MKRPNLKGMGVALITPFKNDESIDFKALGLLIEYQIQNGCDYLVVLGTTAETPTLSEEEKLEVARFAVERVRGRIPIILGVGGNNTASVVKNLKAMDLKGIDAILSVVPFYNKPTQEGMYQHFKSIAKASPVPIILYNVPGRTGANLLPDTVLRLAREFPDTIIAIKEASGNIEQAGKIIKNKPQEFMVISGDDGLTYPLIALGACGIISVLGNALPNEFSKMVHLALQGDFEGARKIHYKFSELIRLLFVDGNPSGIKCVLNIMGLVEDKLRLPLVSVQAATYEKIQNTLKELNIK